MYYYLYTSYDILLFTTQKSNSYVYAIIRLHYIEKKEKETRHI